MQKRCQACVQLFLIIGVVLGLAEDEFKPSVAKIVRHTLNTYNQCKKQWDHPVTQAQPFDAPRNRASLETRTKMLPLLYQV